MAYQDVLHAANSLGFQVPAADKDAGQALTAAECLANDYKRLHELQQRLHALQLHVASIVVTDQKQLQRRASSVQAAADTLNTICATKDALADRLRSAKMRPSVPVAPPYQPDFSALLEKSVRDTNFLQDGSQVLHWAVRLDAKPSCWEDQLKCILETAKDLANCLAAQQECVAAISSSGSSGARGEATGLH